MEREIRRQKNEGKFLTKMSLKAGGSDIDGKENYVPCTFGVAQIEQARWFS